ncbi:hypothetical protein Anas_05779 [Armadillidium nasatum]|uniref:MADF domain-containing protein n=1 Tax=Armadillidium nasatum TaxID=96803 RepID=A0A5N5TEZ8_9CRUS|nr:hypothetical protein Anas_05779 [Armadillidium nasatum]
MLKSFPSLAESQNGNFGQLKKVIKFLDIYQSEPQIWDPDHPLHKNKYEVMLIIVYSGLYFD